LDAARRPNILLALALSLAIPAQEAELRQAFDLAARAQWNEANAVLATAANAYPNDKRFPIEQAGVAFKQNQLPQAKRHLRRALSLDPADPFANDFLATLFLLDDNLDAALHYWNRAAKPHLQSIETPGNLRIRPVLLDRALAFAPASQLNYSDYLLTRAQLDQLDIFSQYRFQLEPANDATFQLRLHAAEQNTTPARLLHLLRGIGFQTVFPSYTNWRGRAINVNSLLRWDSQKQRAQLALSAPFRANPATRATAYLDFRRENWLLPGASANMPFRRAEAGARLRTITNHNWAWWSGASLSWRDIQGFDRGFSPTVHAGADYALLRLPAHRFTLTGTTTAELGKLLHENRNPYTRLQSSLRANWLPQARGLDYATSASLHAGKLTGDAPFDALFQLGIERDNDLLLRGHAGTRHGRKGAAPLGRGFVLLNAEVDKAVHRAGFWGIYLGPFLDTGRIGAGPWLIDSGLQAKLRLLTGTALIFSWGRDLRSGGNVFYARLER